MFIVLLHLFLTIAAPHISTGIAKSTVVQVERLPSIPAKPSIKNLDPSTAPQVTAQAIGVWDPQRKAMLYEKNVDTVRATASLAKLMTVLIVVEQGNDLQAVVTMEPQDNDSEGSRLSVPVGARLTVHDLLYATLVESANNATEALVRSTGIAEAEFVRRMNVRAGQLGMANTHFTDVTGLGDSNVSTVDDLVKLSVKAFADPLIADASTTKVYRIKNLASGKTLRITNTDGLVGSDLRIRASKTGFTGKAGGNLVSMIRGIGEHDLLFLVLGSTDKKTRLSDTRMLADWAFASYQIQN